MQLLINLISILWLTGLVNSNEVEYFPVEGKQNVPTSYEYVTGNFVTDNLLGGIHYNATTQHLGLSELSSWEKVKATLKKLNDNPNGDKYKLFYLARHGEGWHNIAPKLFPPYAISCYWKEKMGNGKIEWGDAELTPNGIGEIMALSKTWQAELDKGAPLPESFYVSPIRRCLQTYNYTWSPIKATRKLATPVVKEMAREIYGVDTSNWRQSKSLIKSYLPEVVFESGFTEEDEIFTKHEYEPLLHVIYRANLLLNDIFANDTNEVISISAHGGIIAALLVFINHPLDILETGNMVPVIIKASDFGKFEQPSLPDFIPDPTCIFDFKDSKVNVSMSAPTTASTTVSYRSDTFTLKL